jgi:ABC-type sugar transport system substrate-binding protein
MGEFLTAESGHAGKVIIVYAQAGNSEQEARRRGFEELIGRYPALQLVGVVEDNYDEQKGAPQIKSLLIKYPDVKFIFGAHSRAAVGAVSALRELGYKPGQVSVSGSDTDQDVLDLIKAGSGVCRPADDIHDRDDVRHFGGKSPGRFLEDLDLK